jgi:hypothetical protein
MDLGTMLYLSALADMQVAWFRYWQSLWVSYASFSRSCEVFYGP